MNTNQVPAGKVYLRFMPVLEAMFIHFCGSFQRCDEHLSSLVFLVHFDSVTVLGYILSRTPSLGGTRS